MTRIRADNDALRPFGFLSSVKDYDSIHRLRRFTQIIAIASVAFKKSAKILVICGSFRPMHLSFCIFATSERLARNMLR
jgi:sialic acid synthase SpsE